MKKVVEIQRNIQHNWDPPLVQPHRRFVMEGLVKLEDAIQLGGQPEAPGAFPESPRAGAPNPGAPIKTGYLTKQGTPFVVYADVILN